MAQRIEDEVEVCGRRSCRLSNALFDSGADKTIISRSIADEIRASLTGEKIVMKDASGNEIMADEAMVDIKISGTTCKTVVEVAVPRDPLPGNEVIIGNDFMKETRMQISYQGGPNIACPKNLRKTRVQQVP